MITQTTEVSAIRTSGYSLVITIPSKIAHGHNLNHGDTVYWLPDGHDGLKLKIIRRATVAEIVERQEAEIENTA
jgi:antitoxin component of MazEF toxin-antitoxin module